MGNKAKSSISLNSSVLGSTSITSLTTNSLNTDQLVVNGTLTSDSTSVTIGQELLFTDKNTPDSVPKAAIYSLTDPVGENNHRLIIDPYKREDTSDTNTYSGTVYIRGALVVEGDQTNLETSTTTENFISVNTLDDGSAGDSKFGGLAFLYKNNGDTETKQLYYNSDHTSGATWTIDAENFTTTGTVNANNISCNLLTVENIKIESTGAICIDDNYGTSGQILTSRGPGNSVSWENPYFVSLRLTNDFTWDPNPNPDSNENLNHVAVRVEGWFDVLENSDDLDDLLTHWICPSDGFYRMDGTCVFQRLNSSVNKDGQPVSNNDLINRAVVAIKRGNTILSHVEVNIGEHTQDDDFKAVTLNFNFIANFSLNDTVHMEVRILRAYTLYADSNPNNELYDPNYNSTSELLAGNSYEKTMWNIQKLL